MYTRIYTHLYLCIYVCMYKFIREYAWTRSSILSLIFSWFVLFCALRLFASLSHTHWTACVCMRTPLISLSDYLWLSFPQSIPPPSLPSSFSLFIFRGLRKTPGSTNARQTRTLSTFPENSRGTFSFLKIPENTRGCFWKHYRFFLVENTWSYFFFPGKFSRALSFKLSTVLFQVSFLTRTCAHTHT